MTPPSVAPLTRGEFLKALTGIHERFDGIDKTLALIVEALRIQDRQIPGSKTKDVSQH